MRARLRQQSETHGSVPLASTGASRSQWHNLPLPLPLGPIGMPNGLLLARPDLFVSVRGQGGHAVLTFRIPESPALHRSRTFARGFVADPGANPAGVSASNGGALTFGIL
jgi:hypothetical protein